jgi:hypothetical protein
MSALPPKADIVSDGGNVRYGASGTSASTTAIPLAYPKQLSDRQILAEHDPSIIGATQKRHRLKLFVLSVSEGT